MNLLDNIKAEYFRKISISFNTTNLTSIDSLSIYLSDQSTSSHTYWLDNITLTAINSFFDYNSRVCVTSCPALTVLQTDVNPISCLSCLTQGKIID